MAHVINKYISHVQTLVTDTDTGNWMCYGSDINNVCNLPTSTLGCVHRRRESGSIIDQGSSRSLSSTRIHLRSTYRNKQKEKGCLIKSAPLIHHMLMFIDCQSVCECDHCNCDYVLKESFRDM